MIQIKNPQLNKEENENKKTSSHKSHLNFYDNKNSKPNLIFETGGRISYKNANSIKNIDNNNSNDNNIVKTEPSPIYNKFTIETQNNYNYTTKLSYSDLILELMKYWKKNNVKIKNESFNLYGLPKLNDNINSKIIKLDKIDRVINMKKDYKKDIKIEKDKEKENEKEKEKEKEKKIFKNKINNNNNNINDEDEEDDSSYVEIKETKKIVTKKNKKKSSPNSSITTTTTITKFNRIYPSYRVVNLKFLGKNPIKINDNKNTFKSPPSNNTNVPQKFKKIYPSYKVNNIKLLGKGVVNTKNKIRTSYRVVNIKLLGIKKNNESINKNTSNSYKKIIPINKSSNDNTNQTNSNINNNINNTSNISNINDSNRSKSPNKIVNTVYRVFKANNIKLLSKTPDKVSKKQNRISYKVNNIKIIGKKIKNNKFDVIIPKYRVNSISFIAKKKNISSKTNSTTSLSSKNNTTNNKSSLNVPCKNIIVLNIKCVPSNSNNNKSNDTINENNKSNEENKKIITNSKIEIKNKQFSNKEISPCYNVINYNLIGKIKTNPLTKIEENKKEIQKIIEIQKENNFSLITESNNKTIPLNTTRKQIEYEISYQNNFSLISDKKKDDDEVI